MIRAGFGIVNYYFFLASCSSTTADELQMYNGRMMDVTYFYRAPETSNLKACQDLCLADKNCRAFSHSSTTNKCYLLNRVRGWKQINSSKWTTGVKCDRRMIDKPDYIYTGKAGIET